MKVNFESTGSPADDDVDFVRQKLREYNRSRADVQPQKDLAVFARDDAMQIIGGAIGEVHWGWLYVDLLWVDAAYRGLGIGSQLLARIEDSARQYNVIRFHLGTTDFQALDFYLQAGYEVWGQLKDFPPGHTNYSLCKLNQL